MTEASVAAESADLRQLIASCALRPDSTILEAIAALDRSELQLALVTEEESGRLLGLLTDGDIRRALLAGRGLSDSIDPVYIRDFIRADQAAGRGEVLELMQSLQIRHVPIVDESGFLHGIHFLTRLLTRQERPNAACILAGGKGTRLYPLTREVPKPMLRVAGVPILERILLHLIGHGIRHFYLAVHYLAEVISSHFGDGDRFGCKITYLEERQPLGTGGPLSLIPDVINSPLLVMNGDLVTQFHAGQLLDSHGLSGAELTIASRVYQHTVPFGCLETDGHRVLRLDEKPTLLKQINAGIYVLEPNLLERIPKGNHYPITCLVDDLLKQNRPIHHYEIHDDWADVGRKSELEQVRGSD